MLLLFVVEQVKKGQTQCRRLPHEWSLGKEKTEALPPAKSAERLLRTHDLMPLAIKELLSRRATDYINKEDDLDWAYNGTIESNTLRLRQLSQQHADDNMCKQQQRQPYQHQPL